MAIKEVLHTDLAPAAVGPYSQAIASNGFIYTSGQIPIDPATGKIEAATIEEQTEQVMKNLQYVLAQGGVSFDRVVKTTCFLSDINDFAAFNGVYAKYFTEQAPARSCVQVAALPLGAKVEDLHLSPRQNPHYLFQKPQRISAAAFCFPETGEEEGL